VLRLTDFPEDDKPSRNMLVPNLNQQTTGLYLPVYKDNPLIKFNFKNLHGKQ
jgi:hypothetical protein